MLSLNERALHIVRQMQEEAEALDIRVSTLPGGTTLIDAGIEARSGLLAGKYFSLVCLSGLGEITFSTVDLEGLSLPGLMVTVDHPALACLASQYAGWAVKTESFFAMGSGPARALAVVEPLFSKLGYRDQAQVAVLALEGRKLPDEKVAHLVAGKCGVEVDKLYLLIAPTASPVGSVQIAARVVETGLHKMVELGFPVETVISGTGSCPLAPVAQDDLRAIGRTNDCVLYGGRVHYMVRTQDERVAEIIEKMPSNSSRDYGRSFYDLFQEYGDFYKMDPSLFSPAEVTINNLNSGRSFRAGRINVEVLRASLFGEPS